MTIYVTGISKKGQSTTLELSWILLIGTISGSSIYYTKSSPVNGSLPMACPVKKSDISNSNSLNTDDLEPILEGLHKLREHSFKALSKA